MSDSRYWITCLYPVEKGFFAGAKVHLTECMECPILRCPKKSGPFVFYFPRWISIEDAPLNRKLMVLNRKLAKKGQESRLYCPKGQRITTRCTGYVRFCLYNNICGKILNREGRSFVKSLRWRKGMIYVVTFNDGTVKVVDKKDFGEVNIDNVEIVYPGNLEVKVVTELVPQGEEQEKLKETVATFKEKYVGNVVTKNGLVDFEEWFNDAATGESAVIPETALVPQKSYKVVRIKGEVQKKKKDLDSKQPKLFNEEAADSVNKSAKKISKSAQPSKIVEPVKTKSIEEKSIKKPVKKSEKKTEKVSKKPAAKRKAPVK